MDENKKEELTMPPTIDTLMDAFCHLYAAEKHSYESELAYKERIIMRDHFTQKLKSEGLTPESYFAGIQKLTGKIKKKEDTNGTDNKDENKPS
jgi:hypothetical protein